MKIEINRKNKAYHMEASNEDGNIVSIDGSPAIGGEGKGVRPMQLLLAGIGSCSAIDVISILKKQKQELEDIKITIDGEREPDAVPAVFTKIHLHFHLVGKLDAKKVERALKLSVDQYCSVAKMLEKTAEISYDYSIAEQ
ncbi:MAG: osmotically inducible protein OsmC [Thalassobius sp.]|nr:osmotically inducible protein OsmC [Thalassovita sp.]